MSRFYQRADEAYIDYGLVEINGETFRGPIDHGPDSIAWLGAAQTFGRFVEEPFPGLVGSRLGLGTLNLGSGGKGPDYFLETPGLLEEINRCRAVVIQVMSAKASSNSLFQSKKGGHAGTRLDTGGRSTLLKTIEDLRVHGKRRLASRIARESQQTYVRSMRTLFKAVTPPTVLLWISVRNPPEGWLGYWHSFKTFPQLSTREMVKQIKPEADRYVSVVSRLGMPQVLHDDAGNSVTNSYYPTPEIHRLAADLLTPVLRDLVN